jgi:hypothetical protein
VTGAQATAAMLEAIAAWIDDQLASGGPPKWIAGQAAQAIRYVASMLRTGELP